MKKRYYFYGLLVLGLLFIAYNYYSAGQAEENISELIQTEIENSGALISVQYSEIDISPFRGNIRFEDVTVTQPGSFKRANSLTLDLTYFDFLKFNFGGIEYGLKHLSEALLILDSPSYVDRNTLAEAGFKSLKINYSGEMWDAIQSYFTAQPAGHSHVILIKGSGARYSKPQSAIGSFRSDSLSAQLNIPENSTSENGEPNFIQFSNIIWSPPAGFQNKYAFFIQGFGFEMDSIPFQEAGLSFVRNDERIKIAGGVIQMQLFTANFIGVIQTEPNPQFSPLYISLTEMSSQLKSVLLSVKQLLGVEIPMDEADIQLQLVGPIENPEIISE